MDCFNTISIVITDNVIYIANSDKNTIKFDLNGAGNINTAEQKKEIKTLLNNNIVMLYDLKATLPVIYKTFEIEIDISHIIDVYVKQKILGDITIHDIKSPVALMELNDKLTKEMEETNLKLNIDLKQGYMCWLKHAYCGYELERNGLYWNENRAKEIEAWCEKTKKESLLKLIQSPLSKEYIKNSLKEEYLKFLQENYISEIFGYNYIPKKKTANLMEISCCNATAEKQLESMGITAKVDKRGNKTYKINTAQFGVLATRFINTHTSVFNEWYADYMYLFAGEDKSIKELKKIINPASTNPDFISFVNNMLITDDIRLALLFLSLVKITRDPSYDNDYYKDFVSELNEDVNRLKKVIYPFPTMDEFKAKYPSVKYIENDESRLLDAIYKVDKHDGMTVARKFGMFKKANLSCKKFRDKDIINAIKSSCEFTLESLDSENINRVYTAYTLLGNDIEDENSWSEQFSWLVNFKMFKKMDKLVSTYINGKIGRKSVYYVNKEKLMSGDILLEEYPYFDSEEKAGNENYATVMRAEFGVNTADTGRWTAGVHNIPAGECIKSIYTSRFKGGCITMPDGSQMEVRTLATECQDENLKQAFKDGLDIHRFFASKIFKVPYDEVTNRQRSLSKSAVFGIIYGMSERSFAISYTKGNMAEAKEIYDSLFESFPKIKDYITDAHRQCEELKKVTTLTNRFINLDTNANKRKLLRESQNYRIQGCASDIAGLIMYHISSYIKQHNMKSKIICNVHDSIEIDMHPDDVFELIDVINVAFNVFPLKKFGTPIACDIPIGVSMGNECKIKDNLIIKNNGYDDVEFELSGYVKDINDLIEQWRSVYSVVESVQIDEDTEEYQPLSAMMDATKSTISMHCKETLLKGKRKIHIIK